MPSPTSEAHHHGGAIHRLAQGGKISGYYGPSTGQGVGPTPPSGNPDTYQQLQAAPADPLKEERKKRDYESLFASNVALTYRDGEDAEKFQGVSRANAPLEPPTVAQALPPTPQGSESEEAALRSLLPQSTPPGGPANPSPNAPAAPVPGKGNTEVRGSGAATENARNQAQGKKYVLFEGTVIETVLMNRLDGSFAGPVMSLVSTDVYSHDRQHVLIPAGTKVLGEAQKVECLRAGPAWPYSSTASSCRMAIPKASISSRDSTNRALRRFTIRSTTIT